MSSRVAGERIFFFFVPLLLSPVLMGERTTEKPCVWAAASPRPTFPVQASAASKAKALLEAGVVMRGDTDCFLPPPLSGRSGTGATSGGRRFPPVAKERSSFTSFAENKETAGLPAAPEPGNGRRPVGGRGGGSVRPEPPAPCGRVASASCGGRPSRSPFVRRQPCWEPFLVPVLAPPPRRAAGGGVRW